MKTHQYEFERPEGYLHHRSPYLLVERIISISDSEVVTEKTVHGDESYLVGHFPGAPVLPGAMMQELTTQSAGILIAAKHNPNQEYDTSDPFFNEYALGVLVKVTGARFRSFARPGDVVQVRVRLKEQVGSIFEFAAECAVEGKVIMRNGFQLTNIKSTVLQGA